jgi:hypothetical protein
LKPKLYFRIIDQSLRKRFVSTVKTFSLPQKRMSSISALSLRIPVRSPTLIDLDFRLTTLSGITDKRKQFLTYTQKIARAKLERLRSARLIQGDQKITSRHAKVLIKIKGFISLLATRLSTI